MEAREGQTLPQHRWTWGLTGGVLHDPASYPELMLLTRTSMLLLVRYVVSWMPPTTRRSLPVQAGDYEMLHLQYAATLGV